MKRLILTLFVVAALPSLIFAGTNGKLRGRVLDDKSGDPLIGANVVILGTNYGAATDVNGYYTMMNIPVGTYGVRAALIGYRSTSVSNVRINEDMTSELNFKLLSSEVEMKEVVIVQDRPLVNKNSTNAVRIGTQEEISKMPINNVQNIIALSPGFVQQNGNIYVRGSRPDEVGYYVEGASTRNVVDGMNLTTVIRDAVEEFQVQAGGFGAEYGGANAGMVRQTLRSGTSDFKASIQAETDNFTPLYKKALGTYSYGYSNYVATFSGPITRNIKFFVAGENNFQRDDQLRFWEGFTLYNLPNSNTPRDTIKVFEVQPGNVSGMHNRYTTNGTVTLDFNPYVIRLGGTFTRSRDQGNQDIIANLLDQARLGITQRSNLLLNTKFTHILSNSTSYDVNISYMENRTMTTDPDFGTNYFQYSDSLANAPYGYSFASYATGPTAYNIYGFAITRFGAVQATFAKNHQTKYGGSLDLSSQLNPTNQLKVGASVETYRVSNFSTGSSALLLWYRQNPDYARTSGTTRDFNVAKQGGVNNYGYDFYGNEISDVDNIDGPKAPTFIGGYIEDKLEYNDLVVKAGLRFDYIDNDDFKFIDDPTTPGVIEGPLNPSVDVSVDQGFPMPKATGMAKSTPFKAVSPRLGFSFKVSDRTVFHLQYGKYIQSPSLNNIYVGRRWNAVMFSGGNFIPGPVGFDLQPERSTQYEVGFNQQFTDNASFDITGFYKDIQGQIQIKRVTTEAGAYAHGYNALMNGDFVTTKGFELRLDLRRTNRVRATVNYTFSDAQGTGSTNNSAVSSVEQGTLYPTVISPLEFNQTHRGSINVDYSFEKNDGGPILERMGVNLLFTFNSGHNYTKSTGSIGQQGSSTGALVESDARFSNPLESVNESTTPWVFNLDARWYKDFTIGGLNTEFYFYVQNVLNTKNVLNVYRRTGNAYDDGFLNNPDLSKGAIDAGGQGYIDLYTQANLVDGRAYRNTTGNNLWGTPRQIRFGVKIEI